MLIDCYGPTDRGGVDLAAVAEYAGVAVPTVRRWLAGASTGQRMAAIPPARLMTLQRGPGIVEERNQQQYQYALQALDYIAADAGILQTWRDQGWLEEHTLAIIAVAGKPWQQVVVTKDDVRAQAVLRRRGTRIAAVALPTRFHAQVLAHAVMARQQAWRVHPAPARLALGRTQVWMTDAPAVDLEDLASRVLPGVAVTVGPLENGGEQEQ
ncbi:hypothetical protein [Mycobacteroides abscessus]|uniref:hypothetical protein n=1 Tax=Mycobacteroides abscessus TaxID=36809 RepID=UPI001F2CADCC|nr:hypothetical protein [Mycobacteroides abscessus]